jgi:putative mRNA 3-end processing factor
MSLIESREKGLYCKQADVYIDPWKPVDKAIITHGHSDHSRKGHKAYACVHSSKAILKHRLGPINLTSYAYGDSFSVNGVQFSFHPAGHIIGSAQIRVEYKGEVWVITGDYKLDDDGISEAYEQLQCHSFITESTFGLPVYNWPDQNEVYDDINNWWSENTEENKTSLLTAYSLGKAQRILHHLDIDIGPIYCHGAIANMNDSLIEAGIKLPYYEKVTSEFKPDDFKNALVLAPPAATGSAWMKRFKEVSIGVASGWMALRGARRRRGADRGFILSDHADWNGLNIAIKETGAENIYPTHGYTSIFSKWLVTEGYNAQPIETAFIGESLEVETEKQ